MLLTAKDVEQILTAKEQVLQFLESHPTLVGEEFNRALMLGTIDVENNRTQRLMESVRPEGVAGDTVDWRLVLRALRMASRRTG